MKNNLPVTFEHVQLRKLAQKLARMHMADKQILWLATALKRIGSGNDANIELGVKRKKGQDEKKSLRHMKNQMAIRWIAGRMNPIHDEPPPLKNVAVQEAALAFELDYENLDRICPTEEDLKKLVEFDWDSQRPKINKPRD
jgi:hypothetical protein